MKNPTAAYYYDSKKKRLVVVLHHGQWKTRNLRVKGILSMRHLFTRAMSQTEIEAMSECTRLHSYTYTNWRALFEDEEAMDAQKWAVDELKEFAATHPLQDD